MEKKLKILIAPLNWGLGHASRITPLVHSFLAADCEVVLAADGKAFDFLHIEFPDTTLIQLKDVDIKYSKKLPFIFKMGFQLPVLFSQIKKEHHLLNKIVEQHHIDVVISDNRYGLYHPKTYNILVSHQIYLKLPQKIAFFEPIVHRNLQKMLLKFDELWIPDVETENNLSGSLSHPKVHPHTQYIGILSRLTKVETPIEYDFMVILSGPEPQRTLLEQKILAEMTGQTEKAVLVRGLPNETKTITVDENILIFNHLSEKLLSHYICASKFVICRSGYSSIMDLVKLNKPAILIPTPQQTEQEYLAEYLEGKMFKAISQKEFTLKKAISLSKNLENKDSDSSLSTNNTDFWANYIISKYKD